MNCKNEAQLTDEDVCMNTEIYQKFIAKCAADYLEKDFRRSLLLDSEQSKRNMLATDKIAIYEQHVDTLLRVRS